MPTGFEFNVADPKKNQEGVLPHWTYAVTTRTNLPQMLASHEQSSSFAVRRRFNDFAWLRAQLVQRHPGCLVPPIPEKKLYVIFEKVLGSNDPTALVHHRMRAMRKFLVRVGAHDTLQKDEVLHAFLTLSDASLKRRVADTASYHDVMEQPLHQKVYSFFQSKAPPKEEHAHWEAVLTYTTGLEAELQRLRSAFEQTATIRQEAAKTMRAFGRSVSQSGAKERVLAGGTAGEHLETMGVATEYGSLLLAAQGEDEHSQIVETLVYYCGMCGAARDTIKRLQRALVTRDAMKGSIELLSHKRDTAADGDKKVKYGVQVENVTDEFNNIDQQVNRFTETLKEELDTFHREKSYDIKQLLTVWYELQHEYGLRQSQRWLGEEPDTEEEVAVNDME